MILFVVSICNLSEIYNRSVSKLIVDVRQKDRKTERQKDRKAERQKDRETERQIEG